jgi:hypothetical protein
VTSHPIPDPYADRLTVDLQDSLAHVEKMLARTDLRDAQRNWASNYQRSLTTELARRAAQEVQPCVS